MTASLFGNFWLNLWLLWCDLYTYGAKGDLIVEALIGLWFSNTEDYGVLGLQDFTSSADYEWEDTEQVRN